MAIPEQDIPVDQQVAEIPQSPEISPQMEQAGVSVAPVQVQPVQNNGQVIASPVPPVQSSSGPSITVPAQSHEQLVSLSKGPVNQAKTWRGVFWLYQIKRAIVHGISVIFGGK